MWDMCVRMCAGDVCVGMDGGQVSVRWRVDVRAGVGCGWWVHKFNPHLQPQLERREGGRRHWASSSKSARLDVPACERNARDAMRA